MSFKDLLAHAHHLADLAGTITLKHFRTPVAVSNKDGGGGFDPVTKADKGAERALTRAILARFPDHAVLGEEYGTTPGDAPYRWVLDPIDGTRAFIMGSPLWGTMIGVLKDGEPHLGLIDQPFTQERFWSTERASYATARGKKRKLTTRPCKRLEDAILATTHPDLFSPGAEREAFQQLAAGVRMTRYGGDCYNYCLLAAGFVDLVVEAGLKSYDVVAMIPIIERAGGRVTTWDGAPAAAGGNILAAGDPALHAKALRYLSRRR